MTWLRDPAADWHAYAASGIMPESHIRRPLHVPRRPVRKRPRRLPCRRLHGASDGARLRIGTPCRRGHRHRPRPATNCRNRIGNASAVETASQLTPQQRRRLGLKDLRSPATNGGVRPRIRTALKFGALCATALAVPDVAALLQSDASDVTDRVKDRRLYAPPQPSAVAMRLPVFQFTADALVPKVGNILPALDARSPARTPTSPSNGRATSRRRLAIGSCNTTLPNPSDGSRPPFRSVPRPDRWPNGSRVRPHAADRTAVECPNAPSCPLTCLLGCASFDRDRHGLWSRVHYGKLLGMDELPFGERVNRMVDAATREAARFVPREDRGVAIYRACLGARQILDARPDGDSLRLQQEPPAPDYPDIWARLNRRWRKSDGP